MADRQTKAADVRNNAAGPAVTVFICSNCPRRGARSSSTGPRPSRPEFDGVCPVTRCAKRLLNGPCSGSTADHCEVDKDRPCVWQIIYQRLKDIGQLDRLERIVPPKNWKPSWHGGARKTVRPEHRI